MNEGQQLLMMRAILRPIVDKVLTDFGRTWIVRRPKDKTVAMPTHNNPFGGGSKVQTGVTEYNDETIIGAAFQHDITRDSTNVGSAGSSISVPAYTFICYYEQVDLGLPGFDLVDPESHLIYSPMQDAQEIGVIGLQVAWQVNLKSPSSRGVARAP